MQESTDSLLVPVLAEYDKRESQLRLDAFYTMTHRFAKIKSKRLQAAVSTAMGRALPEEMVLSESLVAEAAAEAGAASKRKRTRAESGARQAQPDDGPNSHDHDDDSDGIIHGDYVDKSLQGFFY